MLIYDLSTKFNTQKCEKIFLKGVIFFHTGKIFKSSIQTKQNSIICSNHFRTMVSSNVISRSFYLSLDSFWSSSFVAKWSLPVPINAFNCWSNI